MKEFSMSGEDGDNETTSFNGLINQGATCYMNSLLQTMFMTPELRKAMYLWQHDPTRDDPCEDSIPYQLQCLFGELQLGDGAVETSNLTQAFGWDQSDGYQQHDVQEMSRVLLDAIERTFAETDNKDLIRTLYEGTYVDYLRCEECVKERNKKDIFMDVSVVLKPFGATKVVGSLEEGLHEYLKPERMIKDNKVECEPCGKKNDTTKGLRFKKFPPILSFHLKRFDFDFQTMRRIKINDRVTFPAVLNMNEFREDQYKGPPSEVPEQLNPLLGRDFSSSSDFQSAPVSPAHSRSVSPVPVAKEAEDKKATSALLAMPSPEEVEAMLVQGEDVYELYAVLVHSGSALGGHYYSFVKNVDDGEWYKFNDSTVTPATMSEVEATFGGAGTRSTYGYYSYTSFASAYLVLYRRIGLDTELPTVEEVPSHVSEIVEARKQERERRYEERKMQRSMMKLFVYYAPNGDYSKVKVSDYKYVMISEKSTFEELTEGALKSCGLVDDKRPAEGCFRIRNYGCSSHLPGRTYGEEDKELPLSELGIRSQQDFMIEIKTPEAEFDTFNPDTQEYMYVKMPATEDDNGENWKSSVAIMPLNSDVPTMTAIAAKAMGINVKTVIEGKEECEEDDVQQSNDDSDAIPIDRLALCTITAPYYHSGSECKSALVTAPFKKAVATSYYTSSYAATKLIYLLVRDAEAENFDDEQVKYRKVFDTELNTIEVAVKGNEGETSVVKEISVDKRNPTKTLFEKIAIAFNIEMGKFRLRKVIHKELVDIGAETMAKGGVYNNGKLQIEEGAPLRPGEIILKMKIIKGDCGYNTENATYLMGSSEENMEVSETPEVEVKEEVKAEEIEEETKGEKSDEEKPDDEIPVGIPVVDANGRKWSSDPITHEIMSKPGETISVFKNHTMEQVREAIFNEYLPIIASAYPDFTPTPEHIRLRKRGMTCDTVLGKPLPREGSLSDGLNYVTDNTELIIQVLPKPDTVLHSNVIVVQAIIFDRENYKFGITTEVSASTNEEASEIFATMLGCDKNNVMFAKSYKIPDLGSIETTRWEGFNFKSVNDLKKYPYFWSSGSNILIADRSKDLKKPHVNEIMKLRPEKPASSTSTYTGTYTSYSRWTSSTYSRKEQSLVIKTKKERQKEKDSKKEEGTSSSADASISAGLAMVPYDEENSMSTEDACVGDEEPMDIGSSDNDDLADGMDIDLSVVGQPVDIMGMVNEGIPDPDVEALL
eukprot:TRINITY_DN9109_c0_g1_i1.p1 TRINITY_DN9109_c0_g1~~TRINITY_DN9109_c0_g1_i1.p1  ORF type:complete len:1223 (+),score=453.86 TRINITY_DN9109_c0_g1_i1:116-3784(+)